LAQNDEGQMSIQVDMWLRGTDQASSASVEGVSSEAKSWTDSDVRQVLEGMLGAMHRLKHADQPADVIALRGLSWIVNPYEDGGVVIAIEIEMGAAVAGPFDIDQRALETMISRVLARPVAQQAAPTVH